MVAATRPVLSVIGEEENSKRRQILDGARNVFLNLGFDGASMGEIARAAGVSKGTLYVYFADKNRLFEAIVEQEVLEQGKAAFNFDLSRDVARRCWNSAMPILNCSAGPAGVGDPNRHGHRRTDARGRSPLL